MVTNCGFKEDFKNNFKITILTIEYCNGVRFKDIFETTVSNRGSKENYKTIVMDCGFKDISETTVTNYSFRIIMIKKILKNILKSQY